MNTTEILSKLAANRAEFFRLLDELEPAIGRDVDVHALQVHIDCALSGRDGVTEQEALTALRACCPLRAVR